MNDQLYLLPESLQSLFLVPYKRIAELSQYTHQGKELNFSYEFQLSPRLRLQQLQIVLNNQLPFTQLINVSLLYGIEPISGVLLRSTTNLYFVEGMKYVINQSNPSETGIIFETKMPPSYLFTFYIGYFVSKIGSLSKYTVNLSNNVFKLHTQ